MAQGDNSYLRLSDDYISNPFTASEICKKEGAAIRRRRERNRLAESGGEKVGDRTDAGVTGLALSGGGIRSASLGLGALQALHASVGIEGIDYLSTVSGGGYVGSCLTAALHQSKGEYPFTHPKQYCDTAAVRHIRDFSNYLIPRGTLDGLSALSIFLRGLFANIILMLPFLLGSVWLTLVSYPNLNSLGTPRFFWWDLSSLIPDQIPGKATLLAMHGFWVTSILSALDVFVLIAWAYEKSFATSIKRRPLGHPSRRYESAELHGPWSRLVQFLLVVTAVVAWIELQPNILLEMSPRAEHVHELSFLNDPFAYLKDNFFPLLRDWFLRLTPLLAPIGAVLALASKYFADLESLAKRSPGWRAWTAKVVSKAALWFAALIIPSFLWFLYLKLAYAGIASVEGETVGSSDNFRIWKGLVSGINPTGEAASIFGAFILAIVAALFINPNATTFFRLYRDRLNKAFVFDSRERDRFDDLCAVRLRLHEIDTSACPYPIINAALNLEGSAFANKRGRNADFFMFTPEYTGSPATGYVGSANLAREEPDLDLATAMAISGAAVSANMGAATVKPLVPTLALLNVRLGYWLRNPREVGRKWLTVRDLVAGARRSFLLICEILSLIDERSPDVYLTDGGNIENLALYELLRRRCELIIAIDAEADPTMDFPSLITLERFARSDLGARIDLPWQELQTSALALNKDFDIAKAGGPPVPSRQGPHCAVCEINYSPDEKGLLFYFKSSLSGDENDVIFDYKRRYRDFPHESTLDQFFGEHQLEAYRALGFHMIYEVLENNAPFLVRHGDGETIEVARARALDRLRSALTGRTASGAVQGDGPEHG